MAKMLGLLALGGLIFGAATSLINGLGTPFLAQFLGMGWSWAALGVAGGWVVPTRRVAWLGATCTLLAAVLAYYATDLARGVYDTIDPADPALFRVTTSWTGALSDLAYWWVAALVVGPPLGLVGHAIHRTDRLGFLAEIVVPTIMVANVLLLTARMGLNQTQPGALAAHAVIVVLAVLWAGWAVARRAAGPGSVEE